MKSKDGTKVSRRRFIGAAVATAAASGTASAKPKPVDPAQERLEKLVELYGSEFGDLRKVR